MEKELSAPLLKKLSPRHILCLVLDSPFSVCVGNPFEESTQISALVLAVNSTSQANSHRSRLYDGGFIHYHDIRFHNPVDVKVCLHAYVCVIFAAAALVLSPPPYRIATSMQPPHHPTLLLLSHLALQPRCKRQPSVCRYFT
jgi:hypothetical protein